jgi:hypothetical protein
MNRSAVCRQWQKTKIPKTGKNFIGKAKLKMSRKNCRNSGARRVVVGAWAPAAPRTRFLASGWGVAVAAAEPAANPGNAARAATRRSRWRRSTKLRKQGVGPVLLRFVSSHGHAIRNGLSLDPRTASALIHSRRDRQMGVQMATSGGHRAIISDADGTFAWCPSRHYEREQVGDGGREVSWPGRSRSLRMRPD